MRAKAFGNGHIRGVDLMHRGIDPLHLKESDAGGLTGGIPFVLYQATAGAAGPTFSITTDSPLKFRIIDWHIVMTGAGAGSDTAKLTDGTNDVTNAVDVSSAADTAVVDGGQINDLYHEIDKGGTLNVVTASSAHCIVYVSCITVA